MTIGKKMLLGAISIASFTIVTGAIAISGMEQMTREYTKLGATLPYVFDLQEVRFQQERLQKLMIRMFDHRNPAGNAEGTRIRNEPSEGYRREGRSADEGCSEEL